jgi:hypothetical protein
MPDDITPATPAAPAAAPATPTPATPTPTPAAGDSLLAAAPGETPPAAPAANAEPAVKPEWLPEKFWRDDKMDTEALAKSYHGLEQLLGKKAHAVTVPTDKSTPEEIAAYRKALGIPESPDKYDVRPEQLPEGMAWDDSTAKRVAEVAHKHNIPPAAIKELVALDLDRAKHMNEAAAQMLTQQKAAAIEELKKTYGTELPAKLDLAKRAAATAGIDPNDSGFQSPAMVKFAVWAAQQISDDKLVEGKATSASSAQARARDIMVNPSNPLYARYQSGDSEIVDQVRRMMVS